MITVVTYIIPKSSREVRLRFRCQSKKGSPIKKAVAITGSRSKEGCIMYEPSASSKMRFLSGLTKIMFRSTSGSPELMSESARAFDSDSSVNDETRAAGTAMIATPVRPMAEILVHAARLRGSAARCKTANPAMERETNKIPVRPTLQKRISECEGQRQEEELGHQFVLGQALDELTPPGYARLAEVY